MNPFDFVTGEFGLLSSLFRPGGHVDFRRKIALMPMVYRPVSGFYVAFRKGSRIEQALKQSFADLGRAGLSEAAIHQVFLEGRHPERLSAFLTLIHCGQFNARYSLPAFVDTAEGRRKQHLSLIHRIAIFGREPSPDIAGTSLKDRLQGLREAGESLNCVNREKWTPLHFAVRYDNVQTVAALIDRKVNLNAQTKSGSTPLMLAVAMASPQVVATLLKTRADRNRRCLIGQRSALHLAVERGGVAGREIARMLIENGAQPGIQDGNSRTPLHVAVSRGDEAMVATLLTRCNGSRPLRPNWADNQGETALHVACRLGRVAMVKLLLDAGAHPNLVDRHDRTPLASALEAGVQSVVTMLEDAGAIVSATV